MVQIGSVVSAIVRNAYEQAPDPEATYLADDGLLHCSKCGEPVQCRINVFGEDAVVRCICRCIREKLEAYDNTKRQAEIESNRRICFQGAAMIDWRFDADDGKSPKVMNVMRRYAENFQEYMETGKGLLLYGSTETGKTFCASCIANYLIDHGRSVLVTTFAGLVNQMQGLYDKKQKFLDDLNNYSLLVLDDLGAERQSEYMQEQVFNIINARYCSGLPFIITTNIPIAEITKPEDIGKSRIYSRILERCLPVEVEGIKRRKAMLKSNFEEMAAKLGLNG